MQLQRVQTSGIGNTSKGKGGERSHSLFFVSPQNNQKEQHRINEAKPIFQKDKKPAMHPTSDPNEATKPKKRGRKELPGETRPTRIRLPHKLWEDIDRIKQARGMSMSELLSRYLQTRLLRSNIRELSQEIRQEIVLRKSKMRMKYEPPSTDVLEDIVRKVLSEAKVV